MKYTDPNGETIWDITSRQYQNEGENRTAYIGSIPSVNSDTWKTNTVGSYGCLFTCAVNIGNSYNKANHPDVYREQKVSNLSGRDKYFVFDSNDPVMPKDFATGSKEIKKLLKDMTGTDFAVDRYSGSSKNLMLNAVKSLDKGAYIIGKVGNHFINITGDTNGKMEYFDPYKRSVPKNYDWSNVEAIYLICIPEEYNE